MDANSPAESQGPPSENSSGGSQEQTKPGDARRNKGWIGCLIVLVIAVGLLIFAVATYAKSYNEIVASKNRVDERIAQVEVVLQRRFDLIPNLVATVKGAAKHESEVLVEVTRLRSQFNDAQSSDERRAVASELESALGNLIVAVEAYPDLRANSNFTVLLGQLESSENRISVERQRQNQAIQDYNRTVASYPGKLIAAFSGFDPVEKYFESEPEAKSAPKVSF